MLRILSDINDIVRFDVEASDQLISSGVAVNGTFVVKRGDTLEMPSAGDPDAMAIFTESNRDGTAGWSSDATALGTQQLTVLWGKYRALTDQFDGTPSAGDALAVDADGKLAATTLGDNDAVAVCTKASHTVRHLQTDYTVIEILTL